MDVFVVRANRHNGVIGSGERKEAVHCLVRHRIEGHQRNRHAQSQHCKTAGSTLDGDHRRDRHDVTVHARRIRLLEAVNDGVVGDLMQVSTERGNGSCRNLHALETCDFLGFLGALGRCSLGRTAAFHRSGLGRTAALGGSSLGRTTALGLHFFLGRTAALLCNGSLRRAAALGWDFGCRSGLCTASGGFFLGRTAALRGSSLRRTAALGLHFFLGGTAALGGSRFCRTGRCSTCHDVFSEKLEIGLLKQNRKGEDHSESARWSSASVMPNLVPGVLTNRMSENHISDLMFSLPGPQITSAASDAPIGVMFS